MSQDSQQPEPLHMSQDSQQPERQPVGHDILLVDDKDDENWTSNHSGGGIRLQLQSHLCLLVDTQEENIGHHLDSVSLYH